MPPHVLIVSNMFPPHVIGGAEIVAHRQACLLRDAGHEVTVFAGGVSDGAHRPGTLDLGEVDGLPVYRAALRSLGPDGNFHWPDGARLLASVIAARRPEIVHVHNPVGLGANLIPLAKRAGLGTVVTLHDHWGFCFKNTLLRNDGRVCDDVEQCAVCTPRIRLRDGVEVPIRLRRDYVAWCLRQADVLLAPSAYMSAAYERAGLGCGSVRTLSNGIDLAGVPVSTRASPDLVRFACFSYLGEHKGIVSLLEAAERLSQNGALAGRWHLTIAGHGHLAAILEADIARGRFGGAVTYAGRLTHADALALLAGSDVAVLASIWPENEPVTMLEAISAGKAQLASRIGGNLELVEENESGLLFTPGSSSELAAGMARFVSEPGLAARLGRRNADRRERFRNDATIAELRTIYGALPRPDRPADVVVICAGDGLPDRFDLMLHRLHVVETEGRRIRFIWHEWACASAWRDAGLLWLWDEGGPPCLDLAGRALRAGIPLLVPDGSSLRDVAASPGGGLGTYATPLEALAIITALAVTPQIAELAAAWGPAAARLLNAIAPPSSFHRSSASPG